MQNESKYLYLSFPDLVESRIFGGGNRYRGSSERRSCFNRWRGFTGRAGGHRGIMQGLRALDSKEEYFNHEYLELGVIQAGKSIETKYIACWRNNITAVC